ADRIDRRPAGIVALEAGAEQRHADDAIARQRVAREGAVALLEDVERQEHAREQHHVRQREERDGRRQHAGGRRGSAAEKAARARRSWTGSVFSSMSTYHT